MKFCLLAGINRKLIGQLLKFFEIAFKFVNYLEVILMSCL